MVAKTKLSLKPNASKAGLHEDAVFLKTTERKQTKGSPQFLDAPAGNVDESE